MNHAAESAWNGPSADETSTARGGCPRVMTVFGTRPEAIKLAPIIAALRTDQSFDPFVVVSGQHGAILDQVLDVFSITPHVNLDIASPGQTLTDVTTRTLRRLVPVLERSHPDLVVVQGDTTTAFAGALAAFYAGIPVAHVEAGLRTGDIRSPFPEEMNRRLVSELTELHLPPTPAARENLLREGIDPTRVVVTGNTVIDALRWSVRRPMRFTDDRLAPALSRSGRVVLVTAHRRESWGAGMRSIGAALRELATSEHTLTIIVALHPNPAVREALTPDLQGLDNVVLTEPLPYGEFCTLLAAVDIVLTDSGGIQEEAPSLGKPVLVLRDTTERPEAIAAGTARLVGTDPVAIVSQVRRLLHDQRAYESMAQARNPYGDGHAATRTLRAFRKLLGMDPSLRPPQPIPADRAGGAPSRTTSRAGFPTEDIADEFVPPIVARPSTSADFAAGIAGDDLADLASADVLPSQLVSATRP
jgi:UDP-N-acetylglucosamine 2-epimerase (non-hydrolysing)